MEIPLRKLALSLLLAIAVLAITGVVLYAVNDGDVKCALTAKKVVTQANHTEELVSAEKVVPGDIVEYTATYTNTGTQSVKGLLATLPIPAGMAYLPATAKPGKVLASVDGTNFAAVPLKRKVEVSKGHYKTVEVPYAEYRYLRWELGTLAAGKQTSVLARVQVAATAKIE